MRSFGPQDFDPLPAYVTEQGRGYRSFHIPPEDTFCEELGQHVETAGGHGDDSAGNKFYLRVRRTYTWDSDSDTAESEYGCEMEDEPETVFGERARPQESVHHKRQQAIHKLWHDRETGLLRAALHIGVQQQGLPDRVVCTQCSNIVEKEVMRCLDCGPRRLWCQDCCLAQHLDGMSLLHRLEEWREHEPYERPGVVAGLFERVHIDLEQSPVVPLSSCTCDSQSFATVTIVSLRHRNSAAIPVRKCKCTTVAHTLLYHEVWPLTPDTPNVAFTFDTMDAGCSAMLCSAKMSAQTFVLEYLPSLLQDGPVTRHDPCHDVLNETVYKNFNTARNAYLAHCRQFANMSAVHTEMQETVCYACAERERRNELLRFTADANFRTKRLARGGESDVPAVTGGESLVHAQDEVKTLVEDYGLPSTGTQCGANFVAGTGLQNSSFAGVAEPGIFACACNHGVVRRVLCMQAGAGEKISYPILAAKFEVDKIKERGFEPPGQDDDKARHVFYYDNACAMLRSINKIDYYGILSHFRLLLGQFHAYGHVGDCHVLHGPRYREGVGNPDGEALERAWSEVGRMALILRDCGPGQYLTLLSETVLYYNSKKLSKLPSLVLRAFYVNYEREAVARERLSALLADHGVTEVDVAQWLKELHADAEKARERPSMDNLPDGIQYFRAWEACLAAEAHQGDVAQARKKRKLADELRDKCGRQHHLQPDTDEYRAAQRESQQAQLDVFDHSIRAYAHEKNLYFAMTKDNKRPKGQKTFKKIMKLAKSLESKMATAMEERNKLAASMTPAAAPLTSNLISTKSSWFWKDAAVPGGTGEKVPPLIKREMIQLLCQRDRAQEEVAFMRRDAELACEHLERKIKLFVDGTDQASARPSSQQLRGAIALTLRRMSQLGGQLKQWEEVLAEMNAD